MSSDFHVGQRVEYWSPSYAEWIECKIGGVKPDGTVKLEHADGTGVLKESADPSRVRAYQGNGAKGKAAPPKIPAGKAGHAAGPPSGRKPAGQLNKGPSSTPVLANNTPRQASPAPMARRPSQGSIDPKATPTAKPASARSASPSPKLPAAQGAAKSEGELGKTINPKPMYVGDKVKLKASSRTGEVMYIGPATFAGGDQVVGVKLDKKSTSSDGDGKYKGERYFRVSAGFGVYWGKDEVELQMPDQADEEMKQLSVSPAPVVTEFDFEKELEGLVGLSEAKVGLRHARNFIEVQKRRREANKDHLAHALHFAFAHGGNGSGCSAVAQLIGGLLVKLGVLSQGHVVEVTRKDLMSGCSGGDLDSRLKKILKVADGGVLLVCDADTLKDPEKSDRVGEECVQALSKCLESIRAVAEWPQRVCVALAGRRGGVQQLLGDNQQIADLVFARLEFSDLSPGQVAQVLRRLVESNKFQLSKDLSDEKLEGLVRRRMARSAGAGDNAPKNVRLAKAMLEEAVSRQTDRVWAKETLSFTGLTALVEDDFVDRNREQSEAAEAALKRLDGVVGLRPVKEFVRSLYAQLQLEQQRREMGIESKGGSSTLHMVFQGNPGTGKTTVARVVADLMKALGLLRTGHLIEADRAALVAGYSGQTALKTKAVVESALGGVLFVDEAYALAGEEGKDTFGREALDTLIKLVEDYRSDLVVILAGYSKEMATLLDTNPGIRSRFPTVLEFEDYSPEELLEIADQMLLQDVLILSQQASDRLKTVLVDVKMSAEGDPRAGGNGRAVRNILERAKRNQASRLGRGGAKRTQEELCTLQPEDFDGCTG